LLGFKHEGRIRRSMMFNGVWSDAEIMGALAEEIGKEGGFGKGSLYYYFDSKEAIFGEIMERGWRSLWEAVEEPLQMDENPREIFFRVLSQLMEITFQDRNLYEFLFVAPKSQMKNGDEPNWKSYQRRLYGALRGLLEEGMERGEFPRVNPDLLFQAIGGLFHGLLFLGEKKEERMKQEEMEELLSGLLSRRDSVTGNG
ncbi:TetR/AcrR family transcriptional regulator, partial [candidate division TA06 bacterium]|nr:TetR/AcrR family transcriptional regulator [candidate division TA06 bacterium]